MTRSSSPEARPTSVDEAASYYQAVEEFFVSRRGDPLFLSNADWLLIRGWRVAGIPLRVVLRGISDALDAHANSWSRDRKIGSLRYCAAEVEVARERWERALTTGAESDDLGSAFGTLTSALERATRLGPRAESRARAILARLRAADTGGRPRETEAWLAEEERELLAEILREEPDLAARAAEDVAAEIAPYRARMPPRVAKQIEGDALARRVLAAYGLPRLSLFIE